MMKLTIELFIDLLSLTAGKNWRVALNAVKGAKPKRMPNHRKAVSEAAAVQPRDASLKQLPSLSLCVCLRLMKVHF